MRFRLFPRNLVQSLPLRTMFGLLAMQLQALTAFGQANPVAAPNYDEDKLPAYTLPDSLVCEDGTKVVDAKTWTGKRRPELIKLFEEQVYGRSPAPCPISWTLVSEVNDALGGLAIRREVDLFFTADKTGPAARLLIFLPRNSTKSPAFLGLNFNGNHAVHADPGISLNTNWMRPSRDKAVVDNKATEASRGSEASRWPVEMIVNRGFALVTIYYGDIDPDFDDGFQNGIHPLFYKNGQMKPGPEEWGSIAAWAYGLSRALDYLEKVPEVNAQQVAVIGHSRLGKTSLWAGANDERFALVISNNSGCGGAALSRRIFGETVHRINTSFPHWFCDNYNAYNANEAACPVDQHELIALIAPRPVYVASAVQDEWADPKGEFLAAFHADPVYRLLGTDGFGGSAPPNELPAVDHPVAQGTIGYHIRTGEHDVTDYDWQQYLDFATRHFKK